MRLSSSFKEWLNGESAALARRLEYFETLELLIGDDVLLGVCISLPLNGTADLVDLGVTDS